MSIAVVHRADLGRYEIQVSGRPAGFTEYTDLCGVRVFTGGRVDPEFEGHGLGSAMLVAVLDAERKAGNRIRARCAFMRRFIELNPEYRDLVAGPPAKPAPGMPAGAGKPRRPKPGPGRAPLAAQ